MCLKMQTKTAVKYTRLTVCKEPNIAVSYIPICILLQLLNEGKKLHFTVSVIPLQFWHPSYHNSTPTLEPLYNTIVGSHTSDPCYNWNLVISYSHVSCLGQVWVKQGLKVIRKCLMRTNQHWNTCIFYFYEVFPRLKS